MPTFQIVGRSGPRIIFFRKEEFSADMIEELSSSYIYGQWHFDCNQRPRECVIAVGKRKVRRSIKWFFSDTKRKEPTLDEKSLGLFILLVKR